MSILQRLKSLFPNDKSRCARCGKAHEDWPALGFTSPFHYDNLTSDEKASLATLNEDFCIIRYNDQTDRFIRVVMTQTVNDHCEELDYGLWVSLSETNFEKYRNGEFNEPEGCFGWLASAIPEYETMGNIPLNVNFQAPNKRPLIVPHQSCDHPLVKDYYAGISKLEAEHRIQSMIGSLK